MIHCLGVKCHLKNAEQLKNAVQTLFVVTDSASWSVPHQKLTVYQTKSAREDNVLEFVQAMTNVEKEESVSTECVKLVA